MVSTNLDKLSCIPHQNAGVPIQETIVVVVPVGFFHCFLFSPAQFSHITQEMKSDWVLNKSVQFCKNKQNTFNYWE